MGKLTWEHKKLQCIESDLWSFMPILLNSVWQQQLSRQEGCILRSTWKSLLFLSVQMPLKPNPIELQKSDGIRCVQGDMMVSLLKPSNYWAQTDATGRTEA